MAIVSGMLSSIVDICTAVRLCFSHYRSEDDAPETLYMNNRSSSAFTALGHPVPYLDLDDRTSNFCHILSEVRLFTSLIDHNSSLNAGIMTSQGWHQCT